MSLGNTTDTIAHFVGLFHLAVEENRLRDEYLEFKHKQDMPEEWAKMEFAPIRLSASLRLDHFNPKSKYVDAGPAQRPGDGNASQGLPGPDPRYNGKPVNSEEAPATLEAGGPPGFGPASLLPFVPLPAQVVTVTLQHIFMNDNDTYGDMLEAGFMSPEVFVQQLKAIVAFAESVQPWVLDKLDLDYVASPEGALEFVEALQDMESSESHGLHAVVVKDGDLEGTFVNGVLVEEEPEIEDLLPEFIRLKRGPESEDAEDALNTSDADDEPDSDVMALPDRELAGIAKDKEAGLYHEQEPEFPQYEGFDHHVVSGANEAHNAAAIYTSWIDAAVIAVQGDVISVNAVSQVNILHDQDTGTAMALGRGENASQGTNIASIAPSFVPQDDDAETTFFAEANDVPLVWNLERVEGDVTFKNIVEQHTFATDSDQLNVTFTADTTILGSGENQLYNLLQASEYGFGYDLILVGGSMVTMNVIEQTNVLLDDDYFSGAGLPGTAISSHDNALINDAEIKQHGIDEQEVMQDPFAVALAELSNGITQLAEETAQHALFNGMESLRALYIEGDLTQLNIVEQVNYIGDQDQVHMAADAMMSDLDDQPVAITSGSNLLTNTASIEQAGVDSIIMAQGEHYSDALLHQADLIDTDANPHGVNISALANEAVAILVDELNSDLADSGLGQDPTMTDLHSGGTTLDVMQTLTA